MSRLKYIMELKDYFGTDLKRINHALKVLSFADRIVDGENITDEKIKKIVYITAILHDIGIKKAEEKYGSSSGKYQEIEGPPIAREMMLKNSEDEDVVDRVLYIIGGHHTASKNDGIDFQIIWESDLLVNIEEDELYKDREKVSNIVEKNFKTQTGKMIANDMFLS
ncbi:HD domain-containing protein [Thermoanaerobacterium saccharolyticum]|uniref:HD domain-containing protein n=1 Tax=Thermoanaerobacterium saccharolyticum TaxID=28896 RepID=UPI002FDB0DF8